MWWPRSLGGLVGVALLVHTADAASWTPDNAAWNVNMNATDDPRHFYGEWPGHTYYPSPADWRALPIYQLITDRFADGDPTNNRVWPDFTSDHDVRDMTYRHGGDYKGIMDSLDYIKGLGTRAIWISPVFQNGFNKYHQYAQKDFTLLDKRLGTLAELRNLTDAAHARGMYVIIDIVVNHMANEFNFVGKEMEAAPFRMHDTPEREYHLAPRDPNVEQPYADFWFNNTWDPTGNYTDDGYFMYDRMGNPTVDTGLGLGTYSWSDFHHNGDLDDYMNDFTINLGKIYGTMDDLRTGSKVVQDKHIAMAKALIASTDVDSFRIDTPMQVPLGFFKAWAPAVKDYAASLGKTNFGMWGEFYIPVGRYSTMMGRGKEAVDYGQDTFIDHIFTLNGGIDYAYYHYVNQMLFNEYEEFPPALAYGSDGLPRAEDYKTRVDGTSLLYSDEITKVDLFSEQNNRTEYTMWHFCNNHDQWRMQARDLVYGEGRFHACLGWLTFWPGVALHYAGDEQSLRPLAPRSTAGRARNTRTRSRGAG